MHNAKLLIITDMPFWKKDSGGLARLSELVSYLGRQMKTAVLFVGSIEEYKTSAISDTYHIDFYYYRHPLEHNLNSIGCSVAGSFSMSAAFLLWKIKFYLNIKVIRKDFSLVINTILEQISPSHVIIERIHISYLMNDSFFNDTRWKSYLDTHDVMHQRENEIGHSVKKLSAVREKKILNKYNYIICINKRDAGIFKNIGVAPDKLIVTPHAYNIKQLISTEDHNEIRFGYFAKNNQQNFDSIYDFIENSWKYINTHIPCKLLIAGSLSEKRGSELTILSNNIHNLGFVENLESLYQMVDIVINPIQKGSGLKIKNVEALCYGKPLITTSVGAQGMEEGIGEVFIVHDDWQGLTKASQRLIEISEERQRLSNKAIEYAAYYYSHERAYKELIDLLNLELT